MKLSIVVAVSDDDIISRHGKTPWFVRGEMLIFKRLTLGSPVIIGRNTYEQPKAYKSRPLLLPDRLNVVLTTDRSYKVPGGLVAHSLSEALTLDEVKNAPEVFIIGGKQLFDEALPLVQKIYITRIHVKVGEGKSFHFNPADWQLISSEHYAKDDADKRPYAFDFQTWERAK